MPRFSSPEKQAARASKAVVKQLNDKIASIGTLRNYKQALKNVATELARNNESLKDITPERAQSYLEQRAEEVGQKSLDMERQALQAMMQHVTHKLEPDERLPVVKSEHEQKLESRAYTREQVQEIAQHQAPQNSLATEIAYAAGLRAHELATLARIEERAPDARPALEDKFAGRVGERYTVTGKGGLTREVLIPSDLAQRLEDRRLEEPRMITDRGIHYEQRYDIGAGRNFSQSFSRASENALGWSTGAHGLRHSYAQERMEELQRAGASREHALEVVSQEMGHFRPEITETYLR